MNKRAIDAWILEYQESGDYNALRDKLMTKKQRNALMRDRNKQISTGGDDYYHKQSAYTIIKWLLCLGVVAFIICGIGEVVK